MLEGIEDGPEALVWRLSARMAVQRLLHAAMALMSALAPIMLIIRLML
jgi:hypothetical protein